MKFDFETQEFINTLQGMLQDYGRMILQDAKKCYALWLDYGPQLPEEGELLKLFLEQGLGEQVVELKRRSDAERESWRNLAIEKLVKAGETEKDAASLVNAVLEALGWRVKREEPVKPVDSPKPVEPPKPVDSPKPVEPLKPVDSPKPAKPDKQVDTTPHACFGPEEKMVFLNKHLPKIIGYKIAIVPNNVTDWESLKKCTAEFSRGFQNICPAVTRLGINDSDIVLGMIMEEMVLGRMSKALVFSDECIYQIYGDASWRVAYREIERVELQNKVVTLHKKKGEREYSLPFRMEYNSREVFSMLQALVEGERRRQKITLPNSQKIESPVKVENSPYYVRAHGLQPGNALLLRTSSHMRWDNFVKECTYISRARKLLVKGKNKSGTMLYVEVENECRGWVFANSVRQC